MRIIKLFLDHHGILSTHSAGSCLYHKVFKKKKQNNKIHYRFQNFHLFCMQTVHQAGK